MDTMFSYNDISDMLNIKAPNSNQSSGSGLMTIDANSEKLEICEGFVNKLLKLDLAVELTPDMARTPTMGINSTPSQDLSTPNPMYGMTPDLDGNS
jgi:hypothetical protein